MVDVFWRNVRRIHYMQLHVARLQAHYAAQWLARTARAFVAERPHDGHTNLGWDVAFAGLTTHALPDGSRLGLRIADLTLAVVDGAADELPLDGRAEPEVRAWLGGQMNKRGFDARKLDASAPYSIPWHVITTGARYTLDEQIEPLAALAAWFANANAALGAVRKKLTASGLKAPPVRCWPHHFDMDSLVALGRGRSMGIGFSPGDEYCDEPYFYVSIWPEPPIPKLPLLPAMAHWHTHKFLAALAPAHKILAARDQGGYVERFLDAATAAALEALAASRRV
jgi:hypothetical protein